MLSERRKRQVLLGLLGGLLIVTVVGANAVVGAERTVLDAEFVTDGLEDEELYETLADEMAADLQPGEDPVGLTANTDVEGPPVDEMASSVITPSYVRDEVERNVESLYGYLHDDRDELVLAFDLTPVKSGFADEFEAWVLDADAAAFDPRMADMLESEAGFEETRKSFKERQLDRIQSRTDPELSRTELEAIYDDRRDQIRQAAVSQLEDRVAESGGPEPVQAALVDYGTVAVDALVAEQPDYEQFREDEAAARESLATAVGDVVRQMLDEEVPDTMDFTADMDAETRETLETAQTTVTTLDLLALVLPIVAVVFAGLIGYVSRRRSNGLWRVGGVVAVVGVLMAAATLLFANALPGLVGVESGDVPQQMEAALGIATAAVRTIAVQSAVLFVIGLGLVGAGVAVRRDHLPISDVPEPESEPTPDAQAKTEGDSEPDDSS